MCGLLRGEASDRKSCDHDLSALCDGFSPALASQIAEELRSMEPDINSIGARLAPETGTANYKRVSEALSREIQRAGGEIRLGSKVEHILERCADVENRLAGEQLYALRLISCAGCNRIASLSAPAWRSIAGSSPSAENITVYLEKNLASSTI
jgi:glycine/D-amino acid oxidase-like deaminating enzyme